MKAFAYARYGGPEVLQLTDLPKPEPKPDEVLIRIRATAVTSGDRRVRAMDIPRGFGLISRLVYGWGAPRNPVLGAVCAGEIEAVGAAVTSFKPGDAVFAIDGLRMGGYAEYKCMPASGAIALKPKNFDFEGAAALPFGGTTALGFLRRGAVGRGESVLVNGASGGVGTACVQLAKHLGARVTGVCSEQSAELVRSLGAERVIDYAREDFAASGERYDVIVDNAGTAPLARSARALKEDGRLLLVLADLPAMLAAPWAALTTKQKVIAGPGAERAEDLRELARLAEEGELKPVIERSFAFDAMVEAHRYAESGHRRGNVIVAL